MSWFRTGQEPGLGPGSAASFGPVTNDDSGVKYLLQDRCGRTASSLRHVVMFDFLSVLPFMIFEIEIYKYQGVSCVSRYCLKKLFERQRSDAQNICHGQNSWNESLGSATRTNLIEFFFLATVAWDSNRWHISAFNRQEPRAEPVSVWLLSVLIGRYKI